MALTTEHESAASIDEWRCARLPSSAPCSFFQRKLRGVLNHHGSRIEGTYARCLSVEPLTVQHARGRKELPDSLDIRSADIFRGSVQ